MSLESYLDPRACPAERPQRVWFSPQTRALHDPLDARAATSGQRWLHPDGPTLSVDLGEHAAVRAWQESKAELQFVGEQCWSELPPIYARYGTAQSQALCQRLKGLFSADAVLVTDSGMQAIALVADALLERGAHAICGKQVYNKTKTYLQRLCERLGGALTLVDETDDAAVLGALHPHTRLLLCETFTNPLLRAQNPERWGRLLAQARAASPQLVWVVDDTIATPFGPRSPLLDWPGLHAVVGSGTKALGGQDRDPWGYIATRDLGLANQIMDLLAMRGGILDWRRAEAVLSGLDAADEAHARRCENAERLAQFLEAHPRVERCWHPSLTSHPDHETARHHYRRLGSLVSLTPRGDDAAALRVADALASCGLFRCALSFDGVVSKVNHHRTVSEYFTPEATLRELGYDRLIRLGVGLESPDDLLACLNWALWHGAGQTGS